MQLMMDSGTVRVVKKTKVLVWHGRILKLINNIIGLENQFYWIVWSQRSQRLNKCLHLANVICKHNT